MDDKELFDAINELKLDMKEIKTKMDEGMFIRIDYLQTEVKELKSNQRWLVLAILGLFVQSLGKILFK